MGHNGMVCSLEQEILPRASKGGGPASQGRPSKLWEREGRGSKGIGRGSDLACYRHHLLQLLPLRNPVRDYACTVTTVDGTPASNNCGS